MDMERVLFVHEEPATSSETGPPIVVDLGPIELHGGFGISLVCSGPGDVSVTVIKAIGPERWMLRHCLDSIPYHPIAAQFQDREISIIVAADPATAWRLVVDDPQPTKR